MYTKIYWIHEFTNAAKLGIMPRPRGYEWLEDEIVHFKKQNVGVIVSLLQPDEIDMLGLRSEQTLCREYNIQYINFPITDRSIPNSKDKTGQLVNQLRTLLASGSSVVIHCRMGIGRSSVIAAAVLLNTGFIVKEIIERISQIRGIQVPDTEEQMEWLEKQE